MLLQFYLAATLGGSISSGPAPGEMVPDFTVSGFSGAQAGKDFAVLKTSGNAPLALIFVHKITRPTLRLLRPVDDYAARSAKPVTHIIWLTEDRDKTLAYLKRAADSLKLQAPVSVAVEGKDGLEKLGLNDQAGVTILLVRDKKVVSRFAFADPNETDARAVMLALAKMLGK